jgi:hypothetical protein
MILDGINTILSGGQINAATKAVSKAVQHVWGISRGPDAINLSVDNVNTNNSVQVQAT